MSTHFGSPSSFGDQSIFRSLFAAYPDGLLLIDNHGQIVLSNPAASSLLGYDVSELAGMPMERLLPEHLRERHVHHRKAYVNNPQARPMGAQYDLVARRKDGQEVMVEIALSPLRDMGLPYVVAALRGVSEYPRVKKALQRGRYNEYIARMGRLAVDTRDPQVLLSQIPVVAAEALQVNTAMVLLLEAKQPEFVVAAGVGLLGNESVGQRVSNRLDHPAGYALAQGTPVIVDDYRNETRFTVPSYFLRAGFISAMAVPLFDRGRIIGLLTVRSHVAQRFGADEVHFLESLSNLLAATLQRVQTEETLNHSQRLESVGQLTGGIAHDFNNLLTIIQGNLQVLEENPLVAQDAFAGHLVSAASRASRRGAELTRKLLAFSRRQVLSPSRVDVANLIDSLADMLRRTLDSRIQIKVQTQTPCPACLVDAAQLDSALLNIAINARDAMPEGGQLLFSASHCHALPPELLSHFDLHGQPPENFVAIAVTDSGSGMSDEVKERAFEPFFTTKDVGRGTGLGLSTVYGFAKQSRGAVTLESTPGEGTTVTLYLPVHPDLAHEIQGPASREAQVPPGLKVLVVEDEPEVRQVVVSFLIYLGCEVQTCANAEQALQRLRTEPLPGLLLSDVALGAGMRGTELARQVQAQHPSLPILLTSGYSSDLIDPPVGGVLPWDLLRKPYSRDELARAVGRVIAAHRAE